MLAILNVLDSVLLLALVPQVTLLWLELFFGAKSRRSFRTMRAADDHNLDSVVVLVPAHNECSNISATIACLVSQLAGKGQVLVVADNCSDATADVARAQGAHVVERHDPVRRGKSFALAHGIHELSNTPPRVLIVIDADCILGEGALAALTASCLESGRPVQAQNIMLAPTGAEAQVAVAEIAWKIANVTRPWGLSRLNLPVRLTGTGMAIPWAAVSSVNWKDGGLVEDLKLTLELSEKGFPARYCPSALVQSHFPRGEEATLNQRRRWELGTLLMSVTALKFTWIGIRKRKWSLAVSSLDASIPPLSILIVTIVALTSLAAILTVLGTHYSVITLALGVCMSIMTLHGVVGAFKDEGAGVRVGGKAFLQYARMKLRLYSRLNFFSREWTPTSRD